MLQGGSRIINLYVVMIYVGHGFWGWICTIQILHNVS